MFNKRGDAKCWETQCTMCNLDGVEVIESSGINKCDVCIYFEAANAYE